MRRAVHRSSRTRTSAPGRRLSNLASVLGRSGVSLLLAASFLALGAPATPAAAVQATGGSARFPSIEWFSWGADGKNIDNGGEIRTEPYTLAGQPFLITCSIKNIALASGTATGSLLESYRSGTWQGDGFDELYNIGGVDGANRMVVGLSNHTQGTAVSLDFSCSATLAGNDFSLAGLVMADAEASGGAEFVGATIPTTATWRILDRVRGTGCTLDTYARRTVTGDDNRLELYGPANNTCENGAAAVRPGPSAVAFMDGATSATGVTIAGSGKSAIALGVAFNTDFGDAPASYGDAGAALQYAYTGGDIPETPSTQTLAQNRGTPVFGSIALASNVQPSPRLGKSVDPEATQQYSANATGDDVDGVAASGGPDDENGLTVTNPIEVAPGGTLDIGPVTCTGTGFITGWIDWNLNGVFDDATERAASSPACAAGSVNLSFAVPSTILGSGGSLSTFLRVRLAPTAAQLIPLGISTGGEVEDYRLVAAAKARVVLRGTTLGGVSGPFGFTLTNTAQASGTVATTEAETPTELDGDSGTSGNQAFIVSQIGTAVTISESTIPSGWALSSVTCTDGAQDLGSLAGTTFTLPASVVVPGAVFTCDFSSGQPSVSLVKTAGADSGAAAGTTIPYTFTVTNTGQTPLASITISDPEVTGLGCVSTALPIGASTTCTASHTLTQAEVDGGTVVNNASVSGSPPSGPDVTADATETTTIPRRPAIALSETADSIDDLDSNGHDVGDTIAYSFKVTNLGNLTLTGIAVTEPGVGTATCPVTTLAPADSTTCTATYTLTQADVDAGVVHNEAKATGDPNLGGPVTALASADIPITPAPAVTLDKRAGTPSAAKVGGKLAYTFVVTNTGNVTLTSLSVDDPTAGPVACPADTLPPGRSTTCAATYRLTQADIDAGDVVNTAAVTASPPTGPAVTDADSVISAISQLPAVTLDESADTIEEAVLGDLINFSFLASNTGNVALTSVVVTDPMLAAVTCPGSTLAPGESMTCTGTPYTITEQDVELGRVVSSATVSSAFCSNTGCKQVQAGDAVTVTTARVESEHSDGGNTDGGNTAGGNGDGLAVTGLTGAPEMIGLGGGILAAGLLLLLVSKRRKV